MLSSMAQVEPLPLVPATLITGQSKRRPRRSLTARTRSRVISISVGCRRSQWASQPSSVVGSGAVLMNDSAPGAMDAPGRWTRGWESGDGVGALTLQHGQLLGDGLAQLAAVQDHVDRALFKQELGTLEAFGKLLAHGVLDHARAGKADQGLGFGDGHVTQEGERGRDAAQ